MRSVETTDERGMRRFVTIPTELLEDVGRALYGWGGDEPNEATGYVTVYEAAKLAAALHEAGYRKRLDVLVTNGELGMAMVEALVALDALDGALDPDHPEGHGCHVCRAADDLRQALEVAPSNVGGNDGRG